MRAVRTIGRARIKSDLISAMISDMVELVVRNCVFFSGSTKVYGVEKRRVSEFFSVFSDPDMVVVVARVVLFDSHIL